MRAAVLLGFAALAAAHPARAADAPVFATGALPIAPADYAKLPKVQRHRAWLPKSVDLTAEFPLPGYQGQEPDCTAWASTYAARSYLAGRDYDRRLAPQEAMSPAYVYNRVRPAGSGCDQPARLVDALAVLKNEGTVTLATYPDDVSKCRTPAPDTLRPTAAQFRIADWRAIDREVPGDWRSPLVLDDVKGSLARDVPVVFTMPVTRDFMYFKGGSPYQTSVNTQDNYHAMALVGYDEDRQAFRVINSWGKTWAEGGYAWISYSTFRVLVAEAYALEAPAAKPANTPQLGPGERLKGDLAAAQCSTVQVASGGGALHLTGYAGDQATIDTLGADARAVDPHAVVAVAHHPWPQCEAEATLARPLAAGGVSLVAETEAGAVRTGDPVVMAKGDIFGIAAETDAAHPFVSIVYLQADGSAVELYRGEPDAGADGHRRVAIGMSGEKAKRFQVDEPLGNEVLIAIASAQPLFGSELRTYATERQFLTGLRAHLLGRPDGSVSAAVLRLKTG